MGKTLKITENQLKKLMKEDFDEMDSEMGGSHFDNPMKLIQSTSSKLANAIKLKDWYLVKEAFQDVNHFGNYHVGGDEFTDSRESLSKGAMDYNMNESIYDYYPSMASKGDDLKNQIIDLLHTLREYLHGMADADGDSEGYYPNKEMQLLSSIDDILTQIDMDKPSKPVDYSMGHQDDENQLPPPPSEIHINESVQKIKNQFKRFF